MPETFLVFDTPQTEEPIAKRFRMNQSLHASSSGQFTADELPKILQAIPAPRQDIWIVDLRQESHGFIDGLPVSWVGDFNAVNKDKSGKEIAKEEKKLLRIVGKKRSVIVHGLKKLANGKITTHKPTTMLPEEIETEEQLVSSLSAKYARIYVLDHNKPDDSEVDNFVSFIKQKVKDHAWLHFHCRGGVGRSGTFMTMYDIIRNAHNTSFADIIQRQAEIGHRRLDELPTTAEQLWKSEGAQERYAFIEKFYKYVMDPQGYKMQSWSAWQKMQNA